MIGREVKEFGNFMAFDDAEIYKFIGLLFANGLIPCSNFDSWFSNQPNHPLYDANFASEEFDKVVHSRRVPGMCHWHHFWQFFTLSNYKLNVSKEQRKNLMWKVQSLLDELNHRAKKNWIPGEWVASDEQTIGFKGRSRMKLRISYK